MRRSSIALASFALTLRLAAPTVGVAQQPVVPSGPLTLIQAIDLGRSQGVNAAIARGSLEADVGPTKPMRAAPCWVWATTAEERASAVV